MKILLLDDMVERHTLIHKFLSQYMPETYSLYIAYDVKEAIDLASELEFDIMFLDHDLGEPAGCEEPVLNGMNFVKTLITLRIPKPKAIFVHSVNFPAATGMINFLLHYRFNVVRFDVLNINDYPYPTTKEWFDNILKNE
jgi:CheY-like chemotaxis protein